MKYLFILIILFMGCSSNPVGVTESNESNLIDGQIETDVIVEETSICVTWPPWQLNLEGCF